VADSNPALFTADSSGRGLGAVLNQNGSRNSATNPARRGSVVSFFGTGEGQTNPPGIDGKLTDSPAPVPALAAQLLIGNVAAEIEFIDSAPDEVAGLLQINARIPLNISDGQQPVSLTVGEASSPAGVFIVVG
jgi:uncharacterized protein (TIGR03437 family)